MNDDLQIVRASNLQYCPNFQTPWLKYAQLQDNEHDITDFEIENSYDDIRVITERQEKYYLQVVYLIEDEEEFVNWYFVIFSILIFIIILVGGLLGWFITRRAMQHVHAITKTARDIQQGNINLRVPIPNAGEEIDLLAQAFNEMLEQIHVVLKELREISDHVAHDLVTPITAIRGIVETTLADPQRNTAEYDEMSCRILEESDRLVTMIRSMLEITRTESGLFHSDESVEVIQVLADVVEFFTPVCEDKNIEIISDLPQKTFVVQGNTSKLQRAFANFLDNAVKYTPDNGKIAIHCSSHDEKLLITIKDNGIGIAAKDLPHIFERFYRSDQSRSARGNGLGLSLARANIQLHNGTIDVESELAKGTTIFITIVRPHP
ncbi:two-component sensor histidine kinase [Candidatus Uabimicrobium amorphum]|uniref:histidine kinase n=1 Tax=Uabimicrobium amorphum TaxID=2596890 RepID=A0A5S9IVT2_UABAM|nr:HAMP domain-containing sensor histidine kinase [Candidatus Uabimicrobium amorphum]BBM87465.1 two-component sensor histidine kinase [Candidatus Uabimicrobium amorphum]